MGTSRFACGMPDVTQPYKGWNHAMNCAPRTPYAAVHHGLLRLQLCATHVGPLQVGCTMPLSRLWGCVTACSFITPAYSYDLAMPYFMPILIDPVLDCLQSAEALGRPKAACGAPARLPAGTGGAARGGFQSF